MARRKKRGKKEREWKGRKKGGGGGGRSCEAGERKGRIGRNEEGRLMAREKRANARRVWELEVAVG